MNIQDCVAVITGGASGLGEATVRYLVQCGAKASILDFDVERGKKLSAELDAHVLFCRADVTDENSVKVAIKDTIDAFGAIHVAVNCAGMGIPMKVIGKNGPMPIEKFNKVIQVNLVGTINVVRLAAEMMIHNPPAADGEKGVVINTASAAAFEGQIGQVAYSASKAGVVGMTLPIAREFADYGIRVNTIAPGLFSTPMIGVLSEKAIEALSKMMPFPKRLGKPYEFARLVKEIIENPMINGATIRLDAALRMTAK